MPTQLVQDAILTLRILIPFPCFTREGEDFLIVLLKEHETFKNDQGYFPI